MIYPAQRPAWDRKRYSAGDTYDFAHRPEVQSTVGTVLEDSEIARKIAIIGC